jgi:hypothetical protein
VGILIVLVLLFFIGLVVGNSLQVTTNVTTTQMINVPPGEVVQVTSTTLTTTLTYVIGNSTITSTESSVLVITGDTITATATTTTTIGQIVYEAPQNNINLNGNGLTQTWAINQNGNVELRGNYWNLTLDLNSTVQIQLQISGNNNTITVIGGQTNIQIHGNYNTIDAQLTTVSSNKTSGIGNVIVA